MADIVVVLLFMSHVYYWVSIAVNVSAGFYVAAGFW